MMLLLIASFAVVSASENSTIVKDGGYVIEPGHDTNMNSFGVQSVFATITQGRTNWHTKSVSSFITSLNVDLNWGNPSNSLRLKIYSPDGYTFGPYYDSFDGSNNGRINFYINKLAPVLFVAAKSFHKLRVTINATVLTANIRIDCPIIDLRF